MQVLNTLAVLSLLIFSLAWIVKFNSQKKLLYVFFAFIPAFSANYEFSFYRLIFQGLLTIFLVCNLLLVIRCSLRFNAIAKIICIFLFFIGLSYIGNDVDKPTYFYALINFLMISSTLFYIFRNMQSKIEIHSILYFNSYLALIISLYAIIEKILFNDRAETVFSNPNYLGFYLGLGFLALMTRNNLKMKYLFMLLMAFAIYSTGSRIAILGTIIVFLIHALYSLSRKDFYKCLPIFVFSIFSIFSVFIIFLSFNTLSFNTSSYNRFDTKEAESSDKERYAIMALSTQIIKQEPFNGVGYGQFINKFSKFIPYMTEQKRIAYRRDKIVTHNDYIRVIDELGVFAFVFALSFIIYVAIKYRYDKTIWYLFIYTAIFSTAHNNMNGFLFWFYMFLPLHYFSVYKSQGNCHENS